MCLNWLRAVSSLVQEVLNIQYVALKINKIVESDKFEWIKFYGEKSYVQWNFNLTKFQGTEEISL